MSRSDIIKERVLSTSAAADREMAAVRAASNLEEAQLREYLRRFILQKFLLDLNCKEENLTRLSEMSIEKSLAISHRELTTSDLSLGCSAASSVMSKKLLLFMALQRELSIHFDPLRTPTIETIPLLSSEVFQLLKSRSSNP